MTEPEPKEPPKTWKGALRHLGPGLVVSASIVGSGELIMTPKLGAEAGFTLLWFVIFGCVIKVFVQIELGRIAVSKGMTSLEIMNAMPGPRFRVSWLVWLWLLMYLAVLFQVGGIVGGIANIFAAGGSDWSPKVWAVIVAVACAVLLVIGRYRFLERVCTALVVLFTLSTIVGVAALQRTASAISWGNVVEGLSFGMPDDFTIAFACFGIIGVGATELIYYPYWCLEKGYAKFSGPAEDSPAWRERARGWVRVMSVDAWISLAIYTTATVAFFLLGAAVLKGKGREVTDQELIGTLSLMYTESFGPGYFWVFLFGAFAVLFSTFLAATNGKAHLFSDAASLFGVFRYRTPEDRKRVTRAACCVLPLVSAAIYFVWEKPVLLVTIGGLAQAVMLPFLASAALYFRYRRIDESQRPGLVWTVFLWIASLSFAGIGVYLFVQKLGKALG